MRPTALEIQSWLVARVAELTGADAADVDPDVPVSRHGVDSVALLVLAADLEKWLGYRFRENPLEAHPSLSALARFLADEIARCE